MLTLLPASSSSRHCTSPAACLLLVDHITEPCHRAFLAVDSNISGSLLNQSGGAASVWGWLAGDLLTALLLAKLHQQPDHMQHAVEHAIASLQGVLLATVEAAGGAAHVKDRTAEVIMIIIVTGIRAYALPS